MSMQPVYALDVQGHRGARAVLPENSLPAFEYALKLGVSTLELDLGVSKDGQVVVVHDQKLNPKICQHASGEKINKDIWVHKITLAELQAFDCGSLQHPRFKQQQTIANTPIPSLDEVFALVSRSDLPQAKRVRFNIETKSRSELPHAQPAPATFVAAVLKVVDKYQLRDRITLQSFDHRTIAIAKQLDPALSTAALFRDAPNDWVEAAQAVKANIVSPKFTLIKQADVRRMQNAGLQVIPWTVNSPRHWRRLIDMGVDGIITDNPKPLLDLLGAELHAE